MKVTKSERTGEGFALKTGVFEAKVIALNPTRDQLRTLIGGEAKDDEKEFEYVKDDKNGNTQVSLSFWLEDVQSGAKFNHRITITDKKMVSEKSGKQQFVNARGMSQWKDDEKNLDAWFTTATDKDKNKIGDISYRKALQGEANFYDFLRAWGSKIDWFSVDCDVLLDTKKLFRGNVSEIQDLLKADPEDTLVDTVVCLAVVYIKDDEAGETKKYQNIAGVYLPGYKMKNIRNLFSNGAWGSADKAITRWKSQITEGDYAIKEAYSWSLLQDFDENHIAATQDTIRHDTSSVEDTSY